MNSYIESLKKDYFSGNVLKFLEVLEIDLKNYTLIGVSGNSFRITTITTLKECLYSKKFNAGTIIFSNDLDKMISFKNRSIDEESFDFHANCIKTVAEENNLEIGYYEALFLIGLNFFREQKAVNIIVENIFSFLDCINFNYKLVNDYKEDEAYSYSNINMKDFVTYKSELCSFCYLNLDYDPLNYGSFSAYSYALALRLMDDVYPEIKLKKAKKIINDIDPDYIMERINKNPRVILHLALDLNDYNYVVSNIKKITSWPVKTISNNPLFKPDFLIKDTNEIKDIINSADINSMTLILGDKLFVKEVKRFFIN